MNSYADPTISWMLASQLDQIIKNWPLDDWSINVEVFEKITQLLPFGSTILEFGSGASSNLLKQFYKVISENPVIDYGSTEANNQKIINSNSYTPQVYRLEDLVEQDSYVAADFDAWCVDGSVPHAIMHYDQCDEVNRIFILYKTDLPFHTVLELLKQTNSI